MSCVSLMSFLSSLIWKSFPLFDIFSRSPLFCLLFFHNIFPIPITSLCLSYANVQKWIGQWEQGCFLSGPESGASFVRGPESGGQTLDSKDGRYKLCKHLGHYIVILYLFSLICLNKKSQLPWSDLWLMFFVTNYRYL